MHDCLDNILEVDSAHFSGSLGLGRNVIKCTSSNSWFDPFFL